MLNSVRQHICFITQGSYIGYMFRLLVSLERLDVHITPFEANDIILCIPLMKTRWDPSVCIESCDLTN